MKKSFLLKLFLIFNLILFLAAGCGSGGPGGGNVASLEITAASGSVGVGEQLQLNVTARDADGNVIANFMVTYEANIPEYVDITADGLLTVLYPGQIQVVARSGGVTSAPLNLTLTPLVNSGTLLQITDNSLTDNWAANNFFKTLARGVVLWRRILANGDAQILLHDIRDPLDDNTLVYTAPFPTNEVDFMALGTGAGNEDVMASFRVENANTFVSDDGLPPSDLGDNNQEENSIDMGCFWFREGGGFNDIQRYTVADGLDLIADTGELYDPVSSECQAVWEKRNGAVSELVYYDGATMETVATGLPNFPRFDFNQGILVFSRGGDIFMVDTRQGPPFTEIPLTQDGAGVVDSFPKTDGFSVAWHQTDGGDQHIVLYVIATGSQEIISTNTDPKQGLTLQLDLKQLVWLEGGLLFFHDGTGLASGTAEVNVGPVPLDILYRPYLSDGIFTWIGNDGDTEVFMME